MSVTRKWLHVPEAHGADVLMFCGDLTGKMIVPFIKQNDGTTRVDYFKAKEMLQSEAEVQGMKTKLQDIGVYYFDTTADEIKQFQEHPEKVDDFMAKAIEERMKQFCDLIIERIDTKKTKVFVMPGNDDIKIVDEIIKSYEDKNIIYPLDKVTDVGGFETISFEFVNPTPWDTPREMNESDLKKAIDKLITRLSDPSKSIFCFHCPPINTKLDSAPKLNKDLAIETAGGIPQFEHVGSKSVRAAIEKYQPILGLHGHIHEAFGFDQIGKTLVLNPGSEYGEGILRGYIIEMSAGGVDKYWKVEG